MENATALGLLTSTDLSLPEKIQSGESVPLSDFLKGKSDLSQQIIRCGGIFRYIKAVRDGTIGPPHPPENRFPRPMNQLEKMVSRISGFPHIKAGDTVMLPVDKAASYVALSHLVNRSIRACKDGFLQTSLPPEEIELYEDHFGNAAPDQYPELPAMTMAQRTMAVDLGIPAKNYYFGKKEEGGGKGIIHRQLLWNTNPRLIRTLLVTDSHTTTEGFLPLLALPVGSTMAGVGVAEGQIPFTVPRQIIKVEVKGQLPPGCTIRDAQLQQAANFSPGKEEIAVIFSGEGLNNLHTDQIIALNNMAPEVYNAAISVTAKNDPGIDYLIQRWGMTRKEAELLYIEPEEGCTYDRKIDLNLSSVEPLVALPGSPRKGIPLSQIKVLPTINKAFLGSCTLGLNDLLEAAAVLKDQKIARGVDLIIVPSHEEIRNQVEAMGIMNIFRLAGATVVENSVCDACIGASIHRIRQGEVAITASNRNFPRRMGEGDVYMAGPILVALSAIEGRVVSYDQWKKSLSRISVNIQLFNRT